MFSYSFSMEHISFLLLPQILFFNNPPSKRPWYEKSMNNGKYEANFYLSGKLAKC